MFKRGFSTVACADASYKTVIDAAARAHMQAIEIRLDKDDRAFGLEGEGIGALCTELSRRGIAVSDLAAGITVKGYDPDVVRTAEACIALAARMGAPAIRVFPGTFCKKRSEYGGYDYRGMVRALGEICDLAQKGGVQIFVETHNEFSTGGSLKTLIADVGSPNLRIIFDIMHSYEMGESAAQTVDLLGDRIAHVHIKDGVPMQDPDSATFLYTALGAGIVPTREAIAALRAIGYDGYLSLEWEDAWRAEIRGMYPELDRLLADFNAYLDRMEA